MARYWFKPKTYGYGATPATWEGWLATFAGMLVLAATAAVLQSFFPGSSAAGWAAKTLIVGAEIGIFILLAKWRTDGDWRWRWGGDPTGNGGRAKR